MTDTWVCAELCHNIHYGAVCYLVWSHYLCPLLIWYSDWRDFCSAAFICKQVSFGDLLTAITADFTAYIGTVSLPRIISTFHVLHWLVSDHFYSPKFPGTGNLWSIAGRMAVLRSAVSKAAAMKCRCSVGINVEFLILSETLYRTCVRRLNWIQDIERHWLFDRFAEYLFTTLAQVGSLEFGYWQC